MVRIGCLQFAPQVGDVDNNLNRADSVLNRANSADLDSLDLLVLPEMAFSGYNFKSLQHIAPFLEPSGSGISSLWARTTALKHDCVVAVGYPEKVDSSRNWSITPEYYNSLIVVNGNGETVGNYRKSFLYYTDETWAREGGGFFQGNVGSLGQVAMGICMDINPYKFQTPWTTFEFAMHVLEVRANLVILSMAWLTQEDSATFTPLAKEPDMETLCYWIQRLEPIIRKESEEEIIVVFCNRCGMEGEVTYAGTSAVVGIQNGEVSVYGLLGRGVKELMIVNTDSAPFAKLVNRPDEAEQATRHQEPEMPASVDPVSDVAASTRPVPSPTYSPKSPLSPSTASSHAAAPIHAPMEQSEPESDTDMMPRDGTPLVFPSPAPQCEVIDECATEDDTECTEDDQSECESVSDAETATWPVPAQISARPKLEIATAPEMLSPRHRQPTDYRNGLHQISQPAYHVAEGPHSALPKASPFWDSVPEETNWSPLMTGSTMTHRSPWDTELRGFTRSPASRPSSRTTGRVRTPATFDRRDPRSPAERQFSRAPVSPPPLSPRSPTSNFSRPFKSMDSYPAEQVIEQTIDLPANSIPILASPSVFQTNFPRSASAFQDQFASLNQAANEEFQALGLKGRGRSKSVSALSPLFREQGEEQIPQVPELPRPASRKSIKERLVRRSPTKTAPPLSPAMVKHLAQSPTHSQFPTDNKSSQQAPARPRSRGRSSANPSSGSGSSGRRRASVSPGPPCPPPVRSPVEFRSPVWA